MALPRNKKLAKPAPGPSVGGTPKNKPKPPIGKGPVRGGGKGGGGRPIPKGKYFGGRGGYKGVKVAEVDRLVNGIIREEMADLRDERQDVNAESRNAQRQARTDYQRGRGDLRHVFGETRDYLGNLGRQTQQMYGGQMDASQAATAALQQHLGGTYSGAQTGAMDELARLGIQQGGNFSGLQADAANAQAMAAQSGANAQSSMGMAAGNAGALQNLVAGMNQGSFMSHMGQNLNAKNSALADIRQKRMDGYHDVREAMQDAKGSRRDLFWQLMQQLQQTGWSQYMDQRNLGMQQQQLNLQRQQLNKK